MKKKLANLVKLNSVTYRSFMDELNTFARNFGLAEYRTYSRIWEYPWLWSHLKPLADKGLKLLDVGSEMSPLPWYLASQGYDVIVSDHNKANWKSWKTVNNKLGLGTKIKILDAQSLDLSTASVDIYLSVSVIEHVPDKKKVIDEAARVLKPGGLFISTFDICEADMGMTFPEWNGKAISMSEFDEMFKNNAWFENGVSEIEWNKEDIDDYLKWHRTTAPHHNYVTGAAVVRRNNRTWDRTRMDFYRTLRRKIRTMCSVPIWYLWSGLRTVRRYVNGLLK